MRFHIEWSWAHGIYYQERVHSSYVKKLPTSLSKEASGNSLNSAQALPIKVKSILQSKDETPPSVLLKRGVLQF
jgi:hypothetical protein